MTRVFLASRNAKKLEEMQRILAQHLGEVEVVGLDDVPAYDEPVEDAPDFVGNALLKARAGAAVTGLPTIADDSGLCVDALNGDPGSAAQVESGWALVRSWQRSDGSWKSCAAVDFISAIAAGDNVIASVAGEIIGIVRADQVFYMGECVVARRTACVRVGQ